MEAVKDNNLIAMHYLFALKELCKEAWCEFIKNESNLHESSLRQITLEMKDVSIGHLWLQASKHYKENNIEQLEQCTGHFVEHQRANEFCWKTRMGKNGDKEKTNLDPIDNKLMSFLLISDSILALRHYQAIGHDFAVPILKALIPEAQSSYRGEEEFAVSETESLHRAPIINNTLRFTYLKLSVVLGSANATAILYLQVNNPTELTYLLFRGAYLDEPYLLTLLLEDIYNRVYKCSEVEKEFWLDKLIREKTNDLSLLTVARMAIYLQINMTVSNAAAIKDKVVTIATPYIQNKITSPDNQKLLAVIHANLARVYCNYFFYTNMQDKELETIWFHVQHANNNVIEQAWLHPYNYSPNVGIRAFCEAKLKGIISSLKAAIDASEVVAHYNLVK